MKDMKEIRINENNLVLNANRVAGGILPNKIAELTRTVTVQQDSLIDGPVYAAQINVESGDADFKGAVFAQREIYVNTDAKGTIRFMKAVASSSAVTSRATNAELTFCSDINAKEVSLSNAFISGSIYADNITIDNCVVIGGVFATREANIKNSIVGTFHAQQVNIYGEVNLLLPSAFSQLKIEAPNAHLYNLSLADLGGLYRGLPQANDSGRIPMDLTADEIHTTLKDDKTQVAINCYSVANKVLIADLLDSDKFQNHFLLTAAALGPQLLRTYNLGKDNTGKDAPLSMDRIRHFFFDVLKGKIHIQELSGKVDVAQLMTE